MFNLRPSASASWVKCFASPRLRSGYPDSGDDDAAEQGTAGHFVGAEKILGRPVAAGQLAPNGIEIDKEMIKYGSEYADIIRAWNLPVYVETYLEIPEIDPHGGKNTEWKFGGTPDVFAIDYTNKLIKICDYKYGWLIIEPFENWQMICYLSGIINMLKLNGYLDQQWSVEFIVFQPRAPHVEGQLRTWTTTVANLRAHINKLIHAAQQVLLPDAMATVGSQCNFCQARHACTTLQKSNYIAIEMSERGNTMDLTTEQAGRELLQIEAAREILKARQTGLESQIQFDIINRGIASPHFTVERVKCREKWQEGVDQMVIAMGSIVGKDLAKPLEAISPAQCRKLNIDESVIKAYSITPIGDNKLVKTSTQSMKKLFGK